jgi:Flp pilus assembly protein TadG
MVELALLLPMLLLIIFAVIEFARGYNYSDQTTQIANETARWVIVDQLPSYTDQNGNAVAANVNPSPTDFRNYAFARMVTRGLRSNTPVGNIHICGSAGSSSTSGDAAMVRIDTTFTPVAASFIGFTNINLKGRASMRIEVPPGSGLAGGFEAAASCN